MLQRLSRVIALIALSLSSIGVSAAPFAYIANFQTHNVSVIDTASNTVTATVAVGTNPFAVAVNQAGTRVYVANYSSNNVSVIDTSTNTVTATVATGAVRPYGVALNAAGTRAYVTNNLSNSVSVIDTGTNTVIATVPVGAGPSGIAVNPVGGRVYVTNANANNISVIDPASNTVTATVAVGANPYGVAVNPAGTRAYVTNFNINTVSVIDTSTNTVTATVAVGAVPTGVAVNPAGTRIYVSNNGNNTVSVIDASSNAVTATVPLPNSTAGIAVNPAGTRVYAAGNGAANAYVIDTTSNTVIATVAVGSVGYSMGQFIAPAAAATPPTAPAPPIPNMGSQPYVPGITGHPTALLMSDGNGPAMTACLIDTLRQVLGGNPVYQGQLANGGVQVAWNGQLISFYPLDASSGSNLGVGIHLQGLNSLSIVTSCGAIITAPAVYSLNEIGAVLNGMGLSAQIDSQGVITVVVNGTIYVVRPDYLVTSGAPGTPRLTMGSDGLFHFTDSNGKGQVLHPAFLDTIALQTQLSLALGAGLVTIQTDGTALVLIGGLQYVLVPDLTLGVISPAHAQDNWWQDSANHYSYRNSIFPYAATSQGFTMRLSN